MQTEKTLFKSATYSSSDAAFESFQLNLYYADIRVENNMYIKYKAVEKNR